MKTPRFPTIKAAIFDMDGLMLDTERAFHKSVQVACREHGCSIPDEIYALLIGKRSTETQGIITQHLGSEFPFTKVFDRARDFYYENIAVNGVDIKPGVIEILTFLDGRSIPRAVATSSQSHIASKLLTSVGLHQWFAHIVGGNEVKLSKPAPDIFLEAASRLKISPSDCVVFEDSEAGVRAAHSAGMYVVMVPDIKAPSDEARKLSDAVVASLHEAVALFSAKKI